MKTMNLKNIMNAYNKMIDSNKHASNMKEWYGEDNKRTVCAFEEKNIAINEYNTVVESLKNAIKEAEGRASARTITAEEILSTLIRIEDDLHISKKAMDGIRMIADINSQSFPRAYKYTPESTHFSAEYKNGSWRLTDIYRAECKNSFHIHIDHTEESKKAIIERLSNF